MLKGASLCSRDYHESVRTLMYIINTVFNVTKTFQYNNKQTNHKS